MKTKMTTITTKPQPNTGEAMTIRTKIKNIHPIFLATALLISGSVFMSQSVLAGSTMVTNPNGTEELWTFNTNYGINNLTSKINQTDNKGISRTYSSQNNVTSKTNSEGRTTTYTYNTDNQRTSKTEASGTSEAVVTTYEYVSTDIDLVTKTETPSVLSGSVKQTLTPYNTNYTLQSTTVNGFTPTGDAISRSTAFGYNAYGQVTTINGARTDVTDTTTITYYDCNTGGKCGQKSNMTNALGHVTTYDTYDANGRLTQMTNPQGLVTTYSYHPRGWLLSMTQTPPTGAARVTTYTYDNVGQMASATMPDGITLDYTYDAAHDLRSIEDNLGNLIEYTYDVTGNRETETTTDPDGTLARSIAYSYDIRNRVSAINNGGSISQIINDAVGNQTSTIDPNVNPATASSHDGLDRLTSYIDALGGETNYDYNIQDQLTQVESPNGATTDYVYDDLGNLLSETSPDRGVITYTYDDAGNMLTSTDARGITLSYTYDALNRVTQRINSTGDGSSFAQYTYDTCPYGTGRLCQVWDSSGTTSYEYDVYGNITKHTKNERYVDYVTTYSYDAANRITVMNYPDGKIVTYSRDGIGRVNTINSFVNGSYEAIVDNIDYRADGVLTDQTFGNGLAETRSYDLQGRLTNITHTSANGTNSFDYSYDANGNLLTRDGYDTAQPGYTYDALDRISAATTASGAEGMVYDPNGNRTQYTLNGEDQDLNYRQDSNVLQGAESQANNAGISYQLAEDLAPLPADWGYNPSSGQVVGAADFNRDGNGDLFFRYLPNGSRILNLDGTAIESWTPHTNMSSLWEIVASGKDVNGDGTEDVLWHKTNTGQVRLGGSGLITLPTITPDYDQATLGDFDGDGDADIFWRKSSNGEGVIWFMQQQATITVVSQTVNSYGAGNSNPWFSADLNGDGTDDLVQFSDQGNTSVQIYLMQGGAIQTQGTTDTTTFANGGQLTGISDASGDGKADLLFHNPATGDVEILLMDGLNPMGSITTSATIATPATDWRIAAFIDTNDDGLGDIVYEHLNTKTIKISLAAASGLASFAYTYDAAGNLIDNGHGQAYAWDEVGRLYQVVENGQPIATYSYNHQNQRTRKTTFDATTYTFVRTVYHYDLSGNLILETTEAGNPIKSYLWNNGEPIAQVETDQATLSETITYIQTDHLMTPRQGTDAQATVTWLWEGDAFGAVEPDESPDGNINLTTINLRFPGQYQDDETDFYYNWNRYYDPNTGRYISSDPIGLRSGVNTFGYALANSLRYSDPTGLVTCNPGIGCLSGDMFKELIAEAKAAWQACWDYNTCVAKCVLSVEAILEVEDRSVKHIQEKLDQMAEEIAESESKRKHINKTFTVLRGFADKVGKVGDVLCLVQCAK